MNRRDFARLRDAYLQEFQPAERPQVMFLGDNSGNITVSGDNTLVWAKDAAGNVFRVKRGGISTALPAGSPILIGGNTSGVGSSYGEVKDIAAEQYSSYDGRVFNTAYVGGPQYVGYGDAAGNLVGTAALKWTGSQLQLDSDSLASIALTVYHASNLPFIVGQRARGSQASPAAVQSGDVLMRMSGIGRYDASNWSSGSRARMDCTALETWTSIAQGAAVELWGTPIGAVSAVKSARAKGDGFESIIGGQVNRVLATGTQLTLSDGYSLTVNRYYTLQGTATLRLEGDSEMRIL